MEFKDEAGLLSYAEKLEGLKISDISELVGRLDLITRNHTKGIVAEVIETEYFGIAKNSDEEPDFKELKIELKVSPLKYVQTVRLYNAKERNVIKMVDYFDVADNTQWRESSLSKKLNRVLFVLYLHDNSVPATEWKVLSTFLWLPNATQDALIQKDYTIIRDKILAGVRNSERDNDFLGTCPKHQGGYNKNAPSESLQSALRDHPFMGRAEKRGFCIKQRAFDGIIAEGIGFPLQKFRNSIGLPRKAYPALDMI